MARQIPLTREQAGRLPKAAVIRVRLGAIARPMRTRGANFGALWLGPLQITWRMPWLPEVARQLHPEVFADRVPA
jgi:hypothetical protein